MELLKGLKERLEKWKEIKVIGSGIRSRVEAEQVCGERKRKKEVICLGMSEGPASFGGAAIPRSAVASSYSSDPNIFTR